MASSWNIGRAGDAEVVADGLAAFPLAAERLVNRPPKTGRVGSFRGAFPLDELTESLSRLATQLLQLAVFHGGVTRDVAAAEAAALDPEHLDRAARSLIAAGFATIEGDRLTIHPDLDGQVGLMLPLFEDHLQAITSDRLAFACKLWGIDGGTRKADRAEAVVSVLRDPHRLVGGLAGTTDGTLELLQQIVDMSLSGLTFSDEPDDPRGAISIDELLPVDEYDYLARARSMRSGRYGTDRNEPRTPLNELRDRLIVGSRDWGYSVWLWFDVLHAFTGSVFPEWPPPPTPEPVPINSASGTPARVVAALVDLARHLGPQPAEGKKSGDRRPPVKIWRTAAKAVSIDPALGVLLGEIAADLGLIYARSLPTRGRGRNAEYPVSWHPNPFRLAQFDDRAAGSNWLAIIESWAQRSDGPRGRLESVRRRLLLTLLGSLPPGTGWGRADLGAVASHRHWGLSGSQDVDDILGDMALLGVIAPGGEVGLTDAARAAARGADAVNDTIGGSATGFVVQPDHSIIAPRDLDPRVSATLHRYAELESEGGATVWRLSATRLARAATSTDPGAVQHFFTEHSTVVVPRGVVRFIADSMTSVRPVSVTTSGCVITSDDPSVIVDAARHKTAKLTVLAPGVAASPLTAAKVSEVLASKGIILAGTTSDERHAGAVPGTAPSNAPTKITDAADSWSVYQTDPNLALNPPAPVGCTGEQVDELIARLRSAKR